MKNYIQPGEIISVLAGADYVSGQSIVVGDLVGICIDDIATGAVGLARIAGVVQVSKVSAQQWDAGQKVYWDESLGLFTTVSDSDATFAGVAVEAAANPSSTGKIKLNQGAGKAVLVAFAAGADLAGVDGTGNNAAPLVGTEARLDSLDTAMLAVIAALKNAGLMSST